MIPVPGLFAPVAGEPSLNQLEYGVQFANFEPYGSLTPI